MNPESLQRLACRTAPKAGRGSRTTTFLALLLLCASACSGDPFTAAPADATADREGAPDIGGLGPGGDAAAADLTAPALPDPQAPGPFSIAELDDSTRVAATGETVAIHCAHPAGGPDPGPYPVIVVGHGLSLPAAQYHGYLRQLASFGYVALTVDFAASVLSVDNPAEARALLAGIDWAHRSAALAGRADATRVGMSGHSLGGKVALLAATLDSRVKAAFALDPVDGGGPLGCNAPRCVRVAPLLAGLAIPTAFLGETLDEKGGLQPCAPAADNYLTLYAAARSPSVELTALGASHVSFVDDLAGCGLACALCQPASAANARVTAMARALMVAFYQRHLRGLTGYDAWLTGSAAQKRYVASGQLTIVSK